MFLAQVAPATAPTAINSANKFYIIGDLDAVKPDIPPSWTDLILHNLGYIALAFVIGWVAKKALGWAATKFEQSPIAEAAIAAIGKALPTLLPAYALLIIIKENAPYLAHGEWLHFAAVSTIFLTSLAHTTAVFYLVEIPIAWARKVADETDNKLDDVLVPMISTVIKISVILVGGFKAISIIDPKSSEAILGLLAGAVVGLAFADGHMRACHVTRAKGVNEVVKAASAALTLDILHPDSELVGREIKNHLDAAGIRERQCVVALPASWVMSQHTLVPELAPEDANSFLQIEAEKGFPNSPDELHITRSAQKAGGGRFATQLAVRRDQVARLIEVLRADKTVLASKTITPGAWAGKLEFQPGVLEYQGDGTGAVKLRISPAKTSSKRFQGAIDNFQWRENK